MCVHEWTWPKMNPNCCCAQIFNSAGLNGIERKNITQQVRGRVKWWMVDVQQSSCWRVYNSGGRTAGLLLKNRGKSDIREADFTTTGQDISQCQLAESDVCHHFFIFEASQTHTHTHTVRSCSHFAVSHLNLFSSFSWNNSFRIRTRKGALKTSCSFVLFFAFYVCLEAVLTQDRSHFYLCFIYSL